MSTTVSTRSTPSMPANVLDGAREAITYFQPMDDREADRAPLSMKLIRRLFTYTRPHRVRRNWLFVLTLCAACNCRRWPG